MADYEADDVIGTLSKKANKMGFTSYMVTPDKDYLQLLEPNSNIYKIISKSSKPEIITIDDFKNFIKPNSKKDQTFLLKNALKKVLNILFPSLSLTK